jgi:glycosyltransferase involved in cell wall biosynthesis
MNEMRVSVIIPAYRAAGTLGRALKSLNAQSRPPDEIIVIDDGSPDGNEIASVVVEFGTNVRLIRHSNGGAARARNAGIDASQGDLIAFLDADDYWEPDKLCLQIKVLDDHPEVGLVASRFYIQEPGQVRQGPVLPGDFQGPLDQVIMANGAKAFELATRIWTTTVLVRREVLQDQRFVPGLEPAEDRDLWVRLIARSPAYLMSASLATYVQEPNSLSRSNIDTDCGNMLRVVHRYEELLGRSHVRSWEADTYRRWAAGHLAQGRPLEALKPAARRLLRQPFSPQGWYILAKATALSMSPSSIPKAAQ